MSQVLFITMLFSFNPDRVNILLFSSLVLFSYMYIMHHVERYMYRLIREELDTNNVYFVIRKVKRVRFSFLVLVFFINFCFGVAYRTQPAPLLLCFY